MDELKQLICGCGRKRIKATPEEELHAIIRLQAITRGNQTREEQSASDKRKRRSSHTMGSGNWSADL